MCDTDWRDLLRDICLEPAALAPRAAVMSLLSSSPNFESYEAQADYSLWILVQCRPWLTGQMAGRLTAAAYLRNDAIAQQAEFYSYRFVPDQVRTYANSPDSGDMEAIAAFVLACAAHALATLIPLMRLEHVDVVAQLEQYSGYLEAIRQVRECAVLPGLELGLGGADACHCIADLADKASDLAARKGDGHWGEMIRRQLDGTEARDKAIRKKALELIHSGTRLHNLSSKLRDWQRRETGESLSKPAMNSILKKFNLHS